MGAMKNMLIDDTDKVMSLLGWDGKVDVWDFDFIEETIMTSKSMAEAFIRIGWRYIDYADFKGAMETVLTEDSSEEQVFDVWEIADQATERL